MDMRKDYALSTEQRMDCRAAYAMLAEAESTLKISDCVRLALSMHGHSVGAQRTAVAVGADRFLQSVLARGKRSATLSFYESKLAPFLAWAGKGSMDEVKRPALKAWLEGLACGPTMKRMIFRSVRAMYRWGMRQNPPLSSQDPTAGLELDVPSVQHRRRFYSVEAARVLLENAPADLRPAVALSLFAGIRPEELYPTEATKARLQWDAIKFAERRIRVDEDVSKTGKARVIEGLPPALWAWLKGCARTEGPVCGLSYRSALVGIKEALGRHAYIEDGARHSFITYAIEFLGEVERVSLWAGHEGRTTLLHTNYRGLTERRAARAFFALRPPATKKIETFPAARVA